MATPLYHATTLEAALDYAAKGWCLFPVWGTEKPSMAKHPALREVPKWSEASTSDPAQLAAWFTGTGYGIGLDCGKSNVLVLDGDRLDDIPDGVELTEGWILQGNVARRSWLFDMPPDRPFGNARGGWTAGEVRGKGGYVVLPPSYHPEGHEERYRWLSTTGSRKLNPTITDMLENYEERIWLDKKTLLPPGPPCKRVLDKTRRVIEALDDGPRHETMVSGTMAIFRLGADGHTGAKHGLAMIRDSFFEAVHGDRTHPDPHDEFRRAVAGLPHTIPAKVPPEYCGGETCGELAELEYSPEAPERPQIEPDAQPLRSTKGKRVMTLTWAVDDPTIKRTHWLWDGYVPLGELTLCGGRPGIGKSTVGYWLAAQVSRGELDGELKGKPANVLVMAAEDSNYQTINPRLLAHEADMSRIAQITIRKDDLTEQFQLEGEYVKGLMQLVRENDIKLIVFDPIMSFVGANNNTDKDHQVRAILQPIVEMAHELRIAIFAIMHLNKGRGKDPLDRFMGSVGWGAVARSAVLVQVDPRDTTGQARLIGQVKSNLGPMGDNVDVFTIGDHVVGIDEEDGTEVSTSKLEWAEKDHSINIFQAQAQWEAQEGHVGGKVTQKDRAIKLILKHFKTKDRLTHEEVVEVKEEASAIGISRQTLYNAVNELKIEPVYIKGFSPPHTEWVRTNWDKLEEMILDIEEDEGESGL